MKKIIVTGLLIFAATAFSFAQKFAFVDTEYILENISEYRDAQDQLDKLSLEWQKEIEGKFAAVDKLYKDFEAQSVLLPEDMKQKKKDEIIQKEKEAKDLQKKRFGKDGDLFKKRQEIIKPIQDKVYDAVEDLANAQGYAFILDKTGNTSMLYANAKYDKSDEVLSKLGYKPGAIKTGNDKDDKNNKTDNPDKE
ncbi:MAG: OmpH family outer membrane protein [Bacteroidota bacterium]